MKGRGALKRLFIFIGSFLLMSSVMANPEGGSVVSGNATIEHAPNSTVINQTSQQAIINWQSFNIQQHETTHFQQPAGGVALNRINPTEGPSSIFGKLTATGQIILINPAGIYFGPTAVVNVGGLIASTANMSDHDFLNGYYHFSTISPSAAVVNQGQLIAADHGLIALIGGSVENNGTIQANLGKVVLASGDAFTMSFAGNDLIHFSVDQAPSSNPLPNGVKNTGMLIANGGTILVAAKAAAGVLDQVINMQGVAVAQSVNEHQGEIILSSDPDAGVIYVSANLDASGKLASQLGGNVNITGYNILIDSPTRIDVSGDAGGGNINIGGNAHGIGDLPNANATVMASNVMLIADAITSGNGGNVVLWSDHVTKAYGNISAKGGSESGNGGWIETSSHGYLDIAGTRVDLTANHGTTGLWLLDPYDVTISNAVTNNGTFDGGSPNIFTPNNTGSNVQIADISANLAGANVQITTTGAGAEAGNITVVDAMTLTSTNSLSLIADNNIIINNTINGAFPLILNATGTIAVNAAIGGTTPLTSLSFTGATTLNANVSGNAGTHFYNSNVTLGTGVAISNGTGDLTFNGTTLASAGNTLTLNTTGAITVNSNFTGGGNIDIQNSDSAFFFGTVNAGAITATNSNVGIFFINNLTATSVSADNTISSVGFQGASTTISGATNLTNTNFTQYGNGGSTLAFNGGLNASTVAAQIAGDISSSGGDINLGAATLSQDVVITASAGNVSMTSIDGNNNDLTISNSGGTSSVSGIMSNLSSFTKTGSGTLTLSGANTYSGSTSILGGVLSINADTRLGTAPGVATPGQLTLNGGTLQNTTGFTINSNRGIAIGASGGTLQNDVGISVYAGIMAGTGDLTTTGAGGYTFSGNNAGFTGNVNANGTFLRADTNSNALGVGTTAAGPTITVNSGVFNLRNMTGGITANVVINGGGFTDTLTNILNGNITLNVSAILGGSGNITLNGAITGVGSPTFQGPGNFILNQASTYSGTATVIQDGTLQLTGTGNLPSTTSLQFTNVGGTPIFDMNNINQTLAGLTSDAATGSVTLGSATLTVNNSSANTYNGTISGSGGLIKTAAGVLTLTGANAYTGATTINGGTLQAGAANILSDSTDVSVGGSGTYDLNNFSDSVGSISGSGSITLGSATLTTSSSSSTTFSGTISGTDGGLTKAGTGTLTLSGSNSYSGKTTVSAGTLSYNTIANVGGGNSALGAPTTTPDGTIDIGATGILLYTGTGHSSDRVINLTASGGTVTASGSDALTLTGGITGTNTNLILNGTGSASQSGVIATGSGSITKNGTGTWSLSGVNTYTGTTTISSNSGALTITNANALGSGSAGITIGNTTQLIFDLGGNTLANTSTMTIGASTLLKTGANIDTLNNDINGTNGITFNSSDPLGKLILNGNINNGGFTTRFTGAGTIDVNSVLSGSGIYIIGGGTVPDAGLVSLNNANLHTGGTTVSINGDLYLGNNNALGNPAASTPGSDFLVLIPVTAGAISTVDIGNTTITIPDGKTIQISNGTSTSLARILSSGNGTINALGSGAINFTVVNLLQAGGSGTLTINAPITGNTSKAVEKIGAGTLTLSGANTYGGGTTLSAGNLIAANATALGTGGLTVGSGTSFDIDNITFSNALTLSGSTLTLSNNGTLAGAINLATGTSNTITANGGSSYSITNNINGAGDLIIGGTGTVTISNAIGGTTPLTSLNVTNTNTTINNSVSTTGNQTYANAFALNAAATFSSTGGNIVFNNIIDGGYDLSVSSGGTTTFANTLGGFVPLNSLSVSSGGTTLNTGTVNTVGRQSYTGVVTLTGATNFSATGTNPTIAFNSGIAGGQNVTIGGSATSNSSYVLSGNIGANNVTVNGNANTNSSLFVNSSGAQTWTLATPNSGSITGVSGVAGTFSFNDIQSIGNSASNNNTLILQSAKLNEVIISAGAIGSVVDPISFNGFTILYGQSGDTIVFPSGSLLSFLNGAGQALINGVLMTFYGFPASLFTGTSINVSQIIQQPESNASDSANSPEASVNTATDEGGMVVMTSTLQQQINDPLSGTIINPYCGI